MAKVFRVENEAGKGMYSIRNADGDSPDYFWEMSNNTNHPSPRDDIGLKDLWIKAYNEGTYREWNFGFRDLPQLRNWIYRQEWRDEIVSVGGFISVYEVDDRDYAAGDTQCIFRKEFAKKIDTITFEDIYKEYI